MKSSRLMRLYLIPGTLWMAGNAYSQQPFDLDSTFRTTINTWYVSSILPQEDGKVIISGQIKFAEDGPISFRSGARLNPDGTMDPTFAYPAYMGGKLTPWNDRIYQRNGNIVRRSWPDGTLDQSFILMNNDPLFSSLQGGDYHVYPDGRILMSGVHELEDSIRGFEGLYCLIWFSNTGYLDTTRTHRQCAGSLDFFRELPNGQFIGSLGNPPNTASWEGQPTGSNVIRFNADGEWDPSFQANVWWGSAFTFLPLPDGRVYAAGSFRITGITDTLHLVRFMPDGSLDPTFNNFLDFRITDMTNLPNGALLRGLYQLDEARLVVMGQFELIEGETRRNICLIDTSGNLLDDYFSGPGCGNFVYQGQTSSSIGGIVPAPDGSFYIRGAYHGYDDGTTNDPMQRMVSRLYGLNVGVGERHKLQWRMYPNPANTQLTVELEQVPPGSVLLLRDALGREVRRQNVAGYPNLVALQGLGSGLYLLEVWGNGQRMGAQRVVVE